MKKELILALVACGFSALAYAEYWQVYCVTEAQAINGSASREEALRLSSKHVMESGHTVQTRPLKN